jgi:hypothetical protein
MNKKKPIMNKRKHDFNSVFFEKNKDSIFDHWYEQKYRTSEMTLISNGYHDIETLTLVRSIMKNFHEKKFNSIRKNFNLKWEKEKQIILI